MFLFSPTRSRHACVFELLDLGDAFAVHLSVLIDQPEAERDAKNDNEQAE